MPGNPNATVGRLGEKKPMAVAAAFSPFVLRGGVRSGQDAENFEEPAIAQRTSVTQIAGERLVAAVARENHRHAAPRQAAQIPSRNHRRVGIRLTVLRDELRQNLRDVRRHNLRT